MAEVTFSNVLQGAPAAVTRFSDPLTSVVNFATNWRIGYYDGTQPSSATPTIVTSINGLILGNFSGASSQQHVPSIPVTVSALLGKTQFSQVTYAALTGPASTPSSGPAVALTGNSLNANANGYFANIQPTLSNLSIITANISSTVLFTSAVLPVLTNQIRISVQFGILSNTIIISINNVVVGTFIDSAIGRPLTGLPGIWLLGAGNGGANTLSNFSCGPGL